MSTCAACLARCAQSALPETWAVTIDPSKSNASSSASASGSAIPAARGGEGDRGIEDPLPARLVERPDAAGRRPRGAEDVLRRDRVDEHGDGGHDPG